MKTIKLNANCDYCGKPAAYDSRLKLGMWGYTCEECHEIHSAKIPALTTKLEREDDCD